MEGIFGVAVDVSSTLIILFTIYGAFLAQSGAGKFFIDFSLALMGGKPNSAGRTVVLSSFLLGGPSGSGVATTVMIGTVAYPMMAKAGFERNAAGGLLAAGGLGAILSPPVLGAAAFLIAEFLKISYLDVIWMAVIPTCLYYLSLLVMVELDARRFGARDVVFQQDMTLGQMTRRYGFHFISLVAVVVFMLIGYSPMLSVFYATLTTFALSFLRPETALMPAKLVRALADGSIGVLNAATTCACAGIIVGVVTLTGLGLKFSSIVIAYAGGSLLLTAIYTCADRLDHRPRRAGDGLVHHLRGDRGAGADQARRAGLRRAYVHLLLRGPVGSVAADGAVALRGGGDHRRRPVPDDAAILEIHAARLPGAVRLRARPAGHRTPHEDPEGRLGARHRLDHAEDGARPRSPLRRRPRIGLCGATRRSREPCSCAPGCSWSFRALIEALAETHHRP